MKACKKPVPACITTRTSFPHTKCLKPQCTFLGWMDGHLYGDKTSQSRCSTALGCKSVQLKPTAVAWQVQGSPVYLPWGCVLDKPDEENLGVTNCWLLKTRERINCEKEITLDGCFCIIISVSIFSVFDFHLFSFYGYYISNNYFSCARVPL